MGSRWFPRPLAAFVAIGVGASASPARASMAVDINRGGLNGGINVDEIS